MELRAEPDEGLGDIGKHDEIINSFGHSLPRFLQPEAG
jgi:hypothetical protein